MFYALGKVDMDLIIGVAYVVMIGAMPIWVFVAVLNAAASNSGSISRNRRILLILWLALLALIVNLEQFGIHECCEKIVVWHVVYFLHVVSGWLLSKPVPISTFLDRRAHYEPWWKICITTLICIAIFFTARIVQ